MRRPRLSDEDWQTIGYALNCAISDREGLADAYSRTGPWAQEALDDVKRFEKLHKKMFKQQSDRERVTEELRNMPLVSIFDIGKEKE